MTELKRKDVVHCWLTFGLVFLMVTIVGMASNYSTFETHQHAVDVTSTSSSSLSISRVLGHHGQSNDTNHSTSNPKYCSSNIVADPGQLQDVGFAVLYILGICVMFICIHVVCEQHFVVAIEQVVENSSLSPDVVGATIMAAGSSAPELFAALMGVIFRENKDVGVGTVVGSTVFNMLIIVGVSILVSPNQEILVSGRSLFRDCFFYFFSLCIFVGFVADGELSWLNSLFMVLFYIFYIVALFNWQKIKYCIPKFLKSCPCGAVWPCCNVDNLFSDDDKDLMNDASTGDATANPSYDDDSADELEDGVQSQNTNKLENDNGGNSNSKVNQELNDMSPPPSSNKRCCTLATELFLLPFVSLFKYTIPLNDGKSTCRLVASFAASLLWLFILVFLMIEWAEKVNCGSS
jgi:Ca2+/Na+ antiporter